MKSLRVLIGSGAALALALMIGGCGKTGNLFAFTHKADAAAETNVQVLVSDAQAAVETGDYVKAEELYKKAVTQNPQSSEARIGVVNAVTKQIQQQGLDLLSLTKGFTNQSTSAPMLYSMVLGAPAVASAVALTAGYYLFPKDPTAKYGIKLALIEKLYKAFIEHFGPICTEQTDLKAKDVPSILYANLSFGYLMRGVIRIVDKDEDGGVDYVVYKRTSNGEYEVYNTADVSDSADPVSSNKLTTLPSITTIKANGLADLDSAITHMGNAKTYSKDSTAKLWADILDLLTKARKMINDLS